MVKILAGYGIVAEYKAPANSPIHYMKNCNFRRIENVGLYYSMSPEILVHIETLEQPRHHNA